MEIRQQHVQPYLHDIALDQLMADYEAKGYQVSKQDTIGKYHPDLVARKGDEVVVVEVKAGKLTPDKRQQVIGIGDYVRAHKNHTFLVVLATPPKPKKINIPNLDQLLSDYLIVNRPDNLFSELPEYAQITEIGDVIVDEVAINDAGSVVAKGSGTVEIAVGHGPSDKDGMLASDVFPFSFDITLKYDEKDELRLVDVSVLDFDLSSLYE